MRIEPFFSSGELMTSFLVSSEQTGEAVFINLGDVNQKMIKRLKEVKLKTVLICDTRSIVLRNIEVLRKIYGFSFHDFTKDNGVFQIGELNIQILGSPAIFQINEVLFTGNVDITSMLDDLDPELIVLSSQKPISTVKEMIKLRDSTLERSILL